MPAAHLRPEPYTAVTDIAEAEKLFGDRLPQIRKMLVENWITTEFGDMLYDEEREEYVKATEDELWREYWTEYSFYAYYPEVDVLIVTNAALGEYPIDLNDSTKRYNEVGNPRYRLAAPDKRLRINGYNPGGAVDGVDWFIERWNEEKHQYEVIARDLVNQHLWLWSIADMFWTDNDTVLFERNSGGLLSDFYEMTIIEKNYSLITNKP